MISIDISITIMSIDCPKIMIIDWLNNYHLKSGTKGLKTSDVTTEPEYSQDPHYPKNLDSMNISSDAKS